ncbi:hypothetical protein LXL04_030007 [Taraxacum kok-saghyz]
MTVCKREKGARHTCPKISPTSVKYTPLPVYKYLTWWQDLWLLELGYEEVLNTWGIVTDTKGKPRVGAEGYATLLDLWETNNSKTIQSTGTQLANYNTTNKFLDHLDRLYTESKFANQYQLKFDIRALQQSTLTIHKFYASMSALTESANLKAFKYYIDRKE